MEVPFPEDVRDEYPRETSSPAGYQDLLNKTKPLVCRFRIITSVSEHQIKVLLYGIINKRGFMYRVRQENIVVTPGYEDPKHVVFNDFLHCLVAVT